METINDRMEMLVNKQFDGNKAAFAKAVGLPPTGLSNYLGNKRRSKPSVDMVAKIVVALNVDAKWLLIGEGSQEGSVTAKNGGVAVAGNGTAHHITTNVTLADVAVMQERIKSLEALLEEKERLIRVYEKMNK
ncbi:helix-turn-helix domain-containing protein [Hallella colorans]|uniref:helix-turn-helix domain-containing protein n=1 Tax=Hallella colorans TaxID=1703337 RepID=UPI0023F25659|nr:helix-turn-helix transcriptional regulator [Hallella colorans]